MDHLEYPACSFIDYIIFIILIPCFLRRPNLEPLPSVKAAKKKAAQSEDMPDLVDEANYVGCFSSESFFVDKIYGGGSTGANYNLALHHAKSTRKKYFAIAKHGSDGHSFAFSSLNEALGSPRGNMQGGGCERRCADLDNKYCGCADTACTGPTPAGEEHNRRWAVYEIVGGRK